MKKSCPNKTKLQCVWWEASALTVIVFLAVYATISQTFDQGILKELVLSVGTTCAILWSIWVVRTFRNIMTWWIDIQHKVDGACNLLSETKQEIKELKLIKQGK
jgi:hypothetical protein